MNDTNTNHDRVPTCSIHEWDQFLQTTRPDIGYKQCIWWAEFLQKRRWDSFGVVARDGDAICGGATVLVKSFEPGKCFYYVPHGPVLPKNDTDAAEIFDDVMNYVHERQKEESHQVSHVRLEPRWLHVPEFVRGFHQSPGWQEPRDTLLIDLSRSEDEILKQMKKKGRYNIRVAKRHGVRVVEDQSPQGLDDFMHLYKETIRRQGIRRRSTDFFRTLAESLFPYQRGSIFFAEYQGIRLATAFVFYSGDTATYKYGGSLTSHSNVMASYLLQFESMLAAKQRGYSWYDFYGISPKAAPIDKWENFSSFKRKFGGNETSFVPALDFIYDSDAYVSYRIWETS